MTRKAFDKLNEERQENILKSGIAEFAQKTYSEASTDEITKNCGISKGLLFHYFGSKKDFYLFCLEKSLSRLINSDSEPDGNDFYGIIFSVMDKKFELCKKYPDETHFVNMTSREMSSEVSEEKKEIFARYLVQTKIQSSKTMEKAILSLTLKNTDFTKAVEAMSMYTNTLINRYLEIYRDKPDEFFSNSEKIKRELKEYIDLLLYGITQDNKS